MRAPWTELAGRWRAACAGDAELRHLAAGATVGFAVRATGAPQQQEAFGFAAGRFTGARTGALHPEFAVVAGAAHWDEFFRAVPRPPYQSFFGMLMRVDGARVDGDELRFAQHAHLVRRVLEIGREVASGPGPVAADQETGDAAAGALDDGPGDWLDGPDDWPDDGSDAIVGRYRRVTVRGEPLRVFCEEAGTGRDVLFLHTAGADGRQFHRLMTHPGLLRRCRMVAFDLPWHGRSPPHPEAVPGGYALGTDDYAEVVMAVVEALGLDRPVVVGSSMGGQICLELAYRYPDRLGGVVACEAADRVPGRQVPWARHPEVNQALFVPEWVDGLMAPQSPRRYRREVWWGYSQGGFGTFYGDILFYSGDWDGRDRVPRIDTSRCPVVMLTGEYDYSCTPQMSRATADRIPGAAFDVMPGLGHFPMAENPPLFAGYLLDALDRIEEVAP